MNPNRARCFHSVAGAAALVLTVIVAGFEPTLFAQDLSPQGHWKTISDKTGEARSFVKLWMDKGTLFGKIDKLIRKPGQDPNPLCKKCQGEKKDQPIIGMTIMWDLTQDDDEWNGGYILDPDNGKSYRCIVKVVDNGRKLHVRGYIGFSLFGRTQVWPRVHEAVAGP